MVSTDSSTMLALSRNGLSQVDSSTVVLVTDSTTCSNALKAYNTALGFGLLRSDAVHVIRVGSAYVVRDPVERAGEFAADVVLDSRFTIKSRLLG
jgi:hypothetical protein